MKDPSVYSHNNKTGFDNFDDAGDDDLSKSIFYICTNCEGPLVPISTCVFCKRITLRRCTKCAKTRDVKSHDSCKVLISFGNAVVQRNTGDAAL
ncbi:hypothetical protein [Nitrosopumilus sp.]|uniref:hypothetical protein n=1 Tax=Nitrosopumilus sp. TaxID=2024843 RepID=UPI002930A1CE|nr:hypothetical protein [Nitrosopumilus sp.]